MQWGVRKERRRKITESRAEAKELNAREAPGLKAARKDPTFKREVKATKKKEGIKGENLRLQYTKKYGYLTGNTLGDFTNSKGEKVSVDFANAVLKQSVKEIDRKHKAIVLAGFAAAMTVMATSGAFKGVPRG
jgi:hypothetical protein